MITEIDLEHSLGEMVEVSEEMNYRIEMLEVIMGKEALEVIEVEIKVNEMEEILTTRKIIVEEEIVGGIALEISNMAETLEIRSRSR